MEYIQAFIVGLVGSFHCAGMCGPIAIALPLNHKSTQTKGISALLYNLGRICTYGLLGFIFGLLGYGLAFWGLQKWVSIGVGMAMIAGVLFPLFFSRFKNMGIFNEVLPGFKRLFGRLFGQGTYKSSLFVGLLNGFLPCGLVYIALAGAVLMNSPAEGALYMLAFGAGTIPILMAVIFAGNLISIQWRNQIRKLIPYIIILIGILFILRGLDLGIPYISPHLEPAEQIPDCCK